MITGWQFLFIILEKKLMTVLDYSDSTEQSLTES